MSKIVVSDKNIGTCTFEYKDIDHDVQIKEKKELVIKSLAALQLICMSKTKKTESDFNQLIDIIQNAITQLDEETNPIGDENGFFANYYN